MQPCQPGPSTNTNRRRLSPKTTLKALPLERCIGRRRNASDAICISMRRKSCSAKARASAQLVLVGEQPGDREDEVGRPFVGPAGRLLDECLHEAGIDRSVCYVTNSVKHFKFEQRGKRRLHARPNAGEIQRCAWWLGAEFDLLKPKLIVALGATALYSLMGRSVGLTKERGQVLRTMNGTPLLVTVHPSYLLRIRDREDAQKARQTFVADLARTKPYLS